MVKLNLLSASLAALLASVNLAATTPTPQLQPEAESNNATVLEARQNYGGNKLFVPGFEEQNSGDRSGYWFWKPLLNEPQSPRLGQFKDNDYSNPHSGWRHMSLTFFKDSTTRWFTQGAFQVTSLEANTNYRFVGWVSPTVPYADCSIHIYLHKEWASGEWRNVQDLAWRPAGTLPTGWSIDVKHFNSGDFSGGLWLMIKVACNSYRTQQLRFDFDDFELRQIL